MPIDINKAKKGSEGRRVPIRKLADPKDVPAGPTAGKTVEMKHYAIVFQIRCGTWYSRHYHHQVNVIQVPVDLAVSKIRESARKASEIMTEFGGKKVTLLTVEQVTITTQAAMREAGAELLGKIFK